MMGLSACTLLTQLDDLTGAAIPTDAATDGGTEGSSADGSADPDGAPDAGTGDSGADASWCAVNAPDASFCTAFEQADLLQFKRTELDDGTITVDDTAALSPPYSMVATLPALTTGTALAYAYLETRPAVSEVTVEVAVRLEKASSGSNVMQLMKLVTTDGPMQWETGLALEGTTRRLFVYDYDAVSGAYAEPFSARPQPLDVWSTLRFHLKLVASGPGTVDLDIDGARVVTGAAVPSPPAASSTFGVYVGGVYVRAPHSGWTTRIDDVVLDAR
jgi:hypothetical protein